MEREFRQLALREANGTINERELERLQNLSGWRDQLLSPRSAEEVLRQIKRDRLIEKIWS